MLLTKSLPAIFPQDGQDGQPFPPTLVPSRSRDDAQNAAMVKSSLKADSLGRASCMDTSRQKGKPESPTRQDIEDCHAACRPLVLCSRGRAFLCHMNEPRGKSLHSFCFHEGDEEGGRGGDE